jgi:hypothetical protein
MVEPTTVDLDKLIQSFTASISDLQGHVATLQ